MPNIDTILFCGLVLNAAHHPPVPPNCLQTARALADGCKGSAEAMSPGRLTPELALWANNLGLDHLWAATVQTTPDAHHQPQQVVDILAALINSPQHAHTTTCRITVYLVDADPIHEEIAARLAARIGARPLGRCERIAIDKAGSLTVTQASFGGRLHMTRELTAGVYILAIRNAGRPETEPGTTGNTGKVCAAHEVVVTAAIRPTMTLTVLPRAEQHASLDGAKLVISGGRGIGSDAGFRLLYDIADQLGGAVSASLPAVDAGWAPIARQVGQSGKYIRPDIYVAIGISGTPQHMAGIDPHTRIVAINKDAEAPIFNMAQIGIVGEWETILPALSLALEE